uniref:Uncharacterized protein n=1 Tax=Papio anubis TaxID=9555 RepID=A0A8I5NHU1_PAPAN
MIPRTLRWIKTFDRKKTSHLKFTKSKPGTVVNEGSLEMWIPGSLQSPCHCVWNWWVLGLTDFKNEAADPHGVTVLKDGECYSFLKIVCPEFVPSDVQMCLELLPSGGLVVSLSGVKLQTFIVSVTAFKGSASGAVCSSRWAVVLLASRTKLQTFTVSVIAHKGSMDPKSEQQQDLLQSTKNKPFTSWTGTPVDCSWLARAACFYSLIWPHPHPADWSILQRVDWSTFQRADWSVFTEC